MYSVAPLPCFPTRASMRGVSPPVPVLTATHSGTWFQGITTYGWYRGSKGIRDRVQVNMWKTWVGGGAWWFLVPKARIKIIGDCVRLNTRLMVRISGVVLEKSRDVNLLM